MIGSRPILIIGAGRVGCALIEILSPERPVVVIDPDSDALAALPDRRGTKGIRRVSGDATSRLVLERAGLNKTTLLAIVTGDDRVNREVARLATSEFGVEEITVVLDSADELEAVGLGRSQVVLRHKDTATLLLNRLTKGQVLAAGLGLGAGEIREVTVLEGSAAVGQTLIALKPRRWLVAAVYRDEQLVIPHGDTQVRAKDRLMLVGEPQVLRGVSLFLRGGEPVFPLQYGSKIGYVAESETMSEAEWLAERTRSDGVVEVPESVIDVPRVAPTEVARTLQRLDIGTLVLGPRKIAWLARAGLTNSSRRLLVTGAGVPVLISRNTAPYQRILVAATPDDLLEHIATTAIDLARQCGANLVALTVVAASLSRSEEDMEAISRVPDTIRQLGRLHGVSVETIQEESNPINAIRRHAAAGELLVIGASRRTRHSFLDPEVTVHLLHDAPCSVLVVPPTRGAR